MRMFSKGPGSGRVAPDAATRCTCTRGGRRSGTRAHALSARPSVYLARQASRCAAEASSCRYGRRATATDRRRLAGAQGKRACWRRRRPLERRLAMVRASVFLTGHIHEGRQREVLRVVEEPVDTLVVPRHHHRVRRGLRGHARPWLILGRVRKRHRCRERVRGSTPLQTTDVLRARASRVAPP